MLGEWFDLMLEGFSQTEWFCVSMICGLQVPFSWRNKISWGATCVTYSPDAILSLIMLQVYAWRSGIWWKGLDSLRRICILTLCSSCLLSCLNWLDSLTAHYLQKGPYRQSHGTEQVPFVLFIDPTIMYSNTTVFFLGMDVFLISQHAEYQAWQGNGAVILQNYFCGLRQAVPVWIPQHTLKEG